MTEDNAALSGADFTRGIPLTSIKERALLLGHAKGEAVILVRQGDVIHAVGATCTHYGAPLADGSVGQSRLVIWPLKLTCTTLKQHAPSRSPDRHSFRL